MVSLPYQEVFLIVYREHLIQIQEKSTIPFLNLEISYKKHFRVEIR